MASSPRTNTNPHTEEEEKKLSPQQTLNIPKGSLIELMQLLQTDIYNIDNEMDDQQVQKDKPST